METQTSKKIPCLDLIGQHEQIKEEIFEAFKLVYEQTAFSGGHFVETFENDFAKFCDSNFAIGVNNGTNALHLSMIVLGITTGDEVILPANTFIATAWAISYVGAIPVFVDCLPDTWEIDPEKVKLAITKKTKAIVGVHLYGQPCDLDALKNIAAENNLALIEDAAQAQGAEYNEKKVGSIGDIACFSFYPGKNLGACGEGGAITTNNKDFDTRIKKLRNHGCEKRYHHDELGYNMRMGGLEGASLSIKLKYLTKWNERRIQIAKRYFSEIKNDAIKFQYQPENTKSVFHLFVITTNNRDRFIEYLNNSNIFPALHYPVPCHLQKAYEHLNYKTGNFPQSEYLASHCVSLPMFAELRNEQVNMVVEVINAY